ncbi:MAG TPA: 4,5-DOPA dioxygenase extradiol [Desulfuromonadaceae bacterium]|jgi:4,5-DOPA dioxygenase extradiol
MTDLMPIIFFGHGNPMNAVSKNTYTEGWQAIGRSIPCPEAVLAISAHWYIPGCGVTADAAPKTIHDFGGFPRELYAVQYPAPGSPDLARRVTDLLSPLEVPLNDKWGLDHGTWSVLTHIFPHADIPVVQLAIDERQPPWFHYELGKRLAPLREEGILVIGSGNLVHNLHSYAWGRDDVNAYDWAARFEQRVRDLLLAGDDASIVAYDKLGQDAMLSIPTPDHYLPLLYVLGLRRSDDPVGFPVEGVDGGSVSMLTIRFG